MANLQKRFIFGSWDQWTGGEGQPKLALNEGNYYESIVFITKIDDPANGYKIYTHGAYFDTELSSEEVLNIVLPALEHTAGKNINITYSETEGLTIEAESLSDVKGTYTWITGESGELEKNYNVIKQDKLVEAQAVADALTSSLTLSAEVSEEGKGIFTQTFNTLNGTEVEAPTAVIEAGDNIKLEQTATGIKISNTYVAPEVEIPEYKGGAGIAIGDDLSINHTNSVTAVTEEDNSKTLSATDKSFTVKSYSFDSEGHITAPVESTITLPEEAFKNDNTEYEFSLVKNDTNDFSLNLVNANTKNVVDTFSVEGEGIAITQGVGKKVVFTASSQTSDLNFEDTAVKHEYVSAVTQENGKIDVQRAKLPVTGVADTTVDGIKLTLSEAGVVGLADDGLSASLTSKNITVTKKGEEGADSFVYEIKQGGELIGTINHPADMVVESGEVILAEDGLYVGSKVLRLQLANTDDFVDILVSDLVDAYTEGNGITISDTNVISAKVYTEDKYLTVDNEGIKTKGIDTAISTAIQDLDAEVTSTDGTKVQVEVTEVDGKITAVNVTETDIASAQDLADLTAEVAENEEVTAEALADLNSRLEGINTTIENLDLGVTSVKASTTSDHVTVTPTIDTKGTVELTVDVASVDATDTTTYTATGLATDAYVNEKVASAEGSITLTNGDNGEYVFAEEKAGYVTAKHMAAIMNEAWSWGTI